MGGNVLYTPALQAPISLSNPTGQIQLISDTSASQGKDLITPSQAAIVCTGNSGRYGIQVPTAAGNAIVGSGVPPVISGLVTARNPSIASVVAQGIAPTIQAPVPGSVKFHPGHWFWFNATQWGTVANPGPEMNAFTNFVDANWNNTSIQGVEIYLRQKDLEAAQGDYSPAATNVNFILNKVKSKARKLRVMFVVMGRDYSGSVGPATTATWPQYMITNGWALSVGLANNGTQSILNYNNSSAVAAFGNAIKALGSLINNEPLAEMVMIDTETSDPYGGVNSPWTAATYLSNWKVLAAAALQAFPNTLIRIPLNFLSFQPTQDQDIVTWIAEMRMHPGRFALGGPDPEISVGYIIHAAALWRGANVNGTQGIDNRGAMPFVVEVQGPYGAATTPQQMFNYCVGNPVGATTGTYPNNPTGTVTGPSQSGMTPANWQPNHGWYIMWRSDDTSSLNALSFVTSNGPSTLPGIPSEGTWNTT